MNKESNIIVTSILFFLSMAPSFIYVVFNQSSITMGMVFSIVISLFILLMNDEIKISPLSLFLFIIVTLILCVSSLENIIVNPVKNGLSVVVVFLFLLFSYFFAKKIKERGVESFYKSAMIICRTLLIVGFISIFYKVDMLGYSKYVKSVLTFYEPSHFALVLVSFVMISSLYVSYKEKVIYIFSLLYLAIAFPSLILFIITLLVGFLFLDKKTIVISSLFFLILIMIIPQIDKINYFVERINLSSNTTNLSVLVYLQGWIDAYSSFFETHGLGLGFQMAGSNTETWINYRIYELSGMYMNRNDGSFTASKLISEFGFLGIVIVSSYFCLFVGSLIRIRKKIRLNIQDIMTISDIFIVSYIIEMFFRSAGYFTFGTLMLCTGLMIRFTKNVS